jgi:hypothetical protein
MSTITLDLDDDLKEKIQLFLKVPGQDLSTGIINFLSKTVYSAPTTQEASFFPEETNLSENSSVAETRYILAPDPSKTPRIGEYDGLITIPDDFNEPQNI